MSSRIRNIIIAGAGPSGQLLGLLLAKQGIVVSIVEQSHTLDKNPRATHYGPPAMRILNSAGVGDEVRRRGFCPETVAWRRLDGSYIAGLDNAAAGKSDPDRMAALPLDKLGEVLYEHGKEVSTLEYHFGSRVTAIGQNELEAWIDIENVDSGVQSRMSADYIVGCDGANSVIRRLLFGQWEFPGKTWDEQIVATNVYYDFSKFGYSDSNFIIDPENWYMAAKITTDGLWRVTYGERQGLTREQIVERQPEKFKAMLPGHPNPEDYKLINISPYKVHQRLASSLRVGRFLLAADAAHLCNPFGGLGLTGGIVDVGGLSECLVGMHQGLANEEILDVYSKVRRQKYNEIVNPISSDNLRRMFNIHPDEVLEKDGFLQMCKQAESDPKLASAMIQSSHGLAYDFSQHFKAAQEPASKPGASVVMVEEAIPISSAAPVPTQS